MAILFYILTLTSMLYSKYYSFQHKKRLSDKQILELERKINPKFVFFLFISFLPVFSIAVYLLSSVNQIPVKIIIYLAITNLALLVFGYFKTKKLISQSVNEKYFQYILIYYILVGISQLFLITSTTIYLWGLLIV